MNLVPHTQISTTVERTILSVRTALVLFHLVCVFFLALLAPENNDGLLFPNVSYQLVGKLCLQKYASFFMAWISSYIDNVSYIYREGFQFYLLKPPFNANVSGFLGNQAARKIQLYAVACNIKSAPMGATSLVLTRLACTVERGGVLLSRNYTNGKSITWLPSPIPSFMCFFVFASSNTSNVSFLVEEFSVI